MAHFVLLFLISTHTFLTLAAAHSRIEPKLAETPAFSPLNDRNIQITGAPKSRKLGNHHVSRSEPPASGPSLSSHGENNNGHGGTTAEEGGMYLEKQQHHHHHGLGSVDKSIAGGGVILGGLVMAFVVSIVCYIRATRRKSLVEPPTPTTARSVSS